MLALVLVGLGFVLLTAVLIERGDLSLGRHLLRGRLLQAGAPIIYRVVETSTRPGPDACEIRPAERGELYYYLTKKYWRVEEVLQDGWIVALTPRNEHQYLRRDDPNLRKASLLERVRYAARFPAIAA